MMRTFETLKGRVAVVTGATSGVGEATAIRLGSSGMNVVLVDYNEANADAVLARVREEGGDGIFVKCNVADENDVINVFEKAVEKYGKVNVLVNCAGIRCDAKPLHELSSADYDRVMGVNLKGPFLTMKYGVRAMVKTKAECCSIVNIASVSALEAATGGTIYTTSKFGLVGLTKNGAVDYAPYNITVNAICPYMIKTNFLSAIPEEELEIYAKSCPNGRLCTPDEIAGEVQFLISDMARYINGAVLVSDAGKTAGDIFPMEWAEL